MNSGMRYLLREAFGWVFIVGLAAVILANFHEVKIVTAKVLGLPPPIKFKEFKPEPNSRTAVQNAPRSSYGKVRIRRSRGGHYRAQSVVNGRRVDFLVDTGATFVALTYEDARRAGIRVSDRDFTARSRTANGFAQFAPVVIRSLQVGDITLNNIRGSVSQKGALHVSLLGMSFLGRLSRVEMRKGDLILEK